MFKKFVAASLLALPLLFSTGCNKKLGQFSADYFTVNPNPLELVGKKVPATVTANIPSKFFVKNASVTVTPYLVFDGREVASQAYSFQGQDVRGNNPVIYFDRGGTVTIPVSYTWDPAMINSTLELAFNVKQNGKQYVLPRVAVAKGVVATADLASAETVTPALAPDKFQRVIKEKYAADIRFLVNQSNIRDGELQKGDVRRLQESMANASISPNQEIEEINISSYASPDGKLDFNTRLAENREKSTTDYLNKELRKNNISFGELTANFTPEDWEGFQRLVSQSNIQDKELILSVLSMYKDPEQREREIRNLSSIFDQLAEDILPQLRYSRITATINTIGKSDEEIIAAFDRQPNSLTIDELLYAAALTDDNQRKMNIYRTAARLYPDDYRPVNDLGMTQYIDGDYNGAKTSFAQAARINPSAPEPQMNLGLIALLEGDFTGADQKFGAAAGVDELDEALGTSYLMQGNNAAAARAFGNARSNNAALAQILTKDYSKAKSTLGAIYDPDATTYYLTAILGARLQNDAMVEKNLRQAIKMDASLAKRAKQDIEFANYNLSSIL